MTEPRVSTMDRQLFSAVGSSILEPVMPPSPLTKLLAARMIIHRGETVVDLGSGSGALAFRAVELGAQAVYAVELNVLGVRAIYEEARRSNLATRVLPILTDMIAFKDFPFYERIDVIICNPPQLPDNSVGRVSFGAYSAGADGRRYIDAAISTAADIFGRLKSGARRLELVTTSVIGGIEPTLSALRSAGFDYQITGQAEAEFRPAYYEVMHLFPRGCCRWEHGRGFERIFTISASYTKGF